MKSTNVWPRQPFIGLALAAIVGIFAADTFAYLPAGLAGLVLFGALALLRRSSLATYLFAAASFFSIHVLHTSDSPGLRLARELGDRPQAITVHGIVGSEPKVSARGSASFLLRAVSIERDGLMSRCSATLSARWPGAVSYGDEIRVFGVVAPIAGPRNPGEFDMRRYLARHDVRTAFVSRYAENGRVLGHGGGNPILRAAHLSRARMDAALGRGLEDSLDQHSLISGIVLGLRDQTPDEIEEQFQQTGTIHLFATAGLHVGIVAYLLWTMAAVLRLPRKVAICLIVPGLFFYAATTGWNTASVRAATMAAVVLGGAFLDRRVQPANSLAAAAVFLLCVDTQQLFSMGFQLSFAVVGTIILIANPVFNFLVGWFQPDPFLPKSLYSHARQIGLTSWRMVARGASVSLAAWLGSLLLILPYFYLITPVSLFANLAVVPVAFFVLAFGLLALLTATIAPWLSLVFNNANWFLATIILRVVAFFAHAPAGHIYLELPHRPTGAHVAITALDLGAGAAIHLRNGNTDFLIDCGANRDFARVVRGYLRSRGVNRLDGLVLTHGDAAHIGAASAIVHAFWPRQILDNAAPDRSSSHRAIISELAREKIPRQLLFAPNEWKIGRDVVAHVLFPPSGFQAEKADDQALVIQLLIAQRWRVLLTSDTGLAAENFLREQAVDLHSHILIKGQHASGDSGSAEFLDAVQPQLIIASSTPFPESESLKNDWAREVAARGIKLVRQDETGAVTVRFYGDRWEAVSFLRPEILRSANR